MTTTSRAGQCQGHAERRPCDRGRRTLDFLGWEKNWVNKREEGVLHRESSTCQGLELYVWEMREDEADLRNNEECNFVYVWFFWSHPMAYTILVP